ALLPAPGSSSQRARFLLQGGKDARLHLLDIKKSLFGVTGSAGTHLGGEGQDLQVVGGTQGVTAPARLHRKGVGQAFVATNNGPAGYRLSGGKLHVRWQTGTGGTSPVIAGGLLWVYDPDGGLNVYHPSSGKLIRKLPAPSGHWNSPIIAGGHVYLPSGNANDHDT